MYEKDIIEAEKRLAELKAKQEAYDELTPSQRLAIRLHSMNCHFNHTDGCGWEYEISHGKHSWSGNAHSRYLGKAMGIMSKLSALKIDLDTAIEVYKLMK